MKKDIRKQLIEKRNKIDDKELQENSIRIRKKLELLHEFSSSKTILFYVSFNKEVDTHHIIRDYLGKKRIVVPKVEGEDLVLSKIKTFKDLERGNFGILEPKVINEVMHKDIDLVIVPGVAFDMQGYRIGYGRGYYDRLLAKLNCPKIGLAFDIQVLEDIPHNEYDMPVDMIITETKIIKKNL